MPEVLWNDAGPPVHLWSQKLFHEAWPGICKVCSSVSQERDLSAAGTWLSWGCADGSDCRVKATITQGAERQSQEDKKAALSLTVSMDRRYKDHTPAQPVGILDRYLQGHSGQLLHDSLGCTRMPDYRSQVNSAPHISTRESRNALYFPDWYPCSCHSMTRISLLSKKGSLEFN